jgi:hypothetical protein
VFEGDIEACFDGIDHAALMERVRRRVGDKRVLGLVRRSYGQGSSLVTASDVRRSPELPRAESCHRCWPTSHCPFWTNTSPRSGKHSGRNGLV